MLLPEKLQIVLHYKTYIPVKSGHADKVRCIIYNTSNFRDINHFILQLLLPFKFCWALVYTISFSSMFFTTKPIIHCKVFQSAFLYLVLHVFNEKFQKINMVISKLLFSG